MNLTKLRSPECCAIHRTAEEPRAKWTAIKKRWPADGCSYGPMDGDAGGSLATDWLSRWESRQKSPRGWWDGKVRECRGAKKRGPRRFIWERRMREDVAVWAGQMQKGRELADGGGRARSPGWRTARGFGTASMCEAAIYGVWRVEGEEEEVREGPGRKDYLAEKAAAPGRTHAHTLTDEEDVLPVARRRHS